MIIGIHGNSRNAVGLFDDLVNTISPDKLKNTLILVPYFMTKEDSPSSNDLYWTDNGWKQGDLSASSGTKISSFAVVDLLLREAPQAKAIVITGHSAGGQFVQRYAIGSKSPVASSITYLVANAGSYMYLDDKRPVRPATKCNSNRYKYGFELVSFYHYMYTNDRAAKIAAYLKKDVVYLLGELDVTNEDLDTSCPANYQGPNRLERGIYFYESLARQGDHNHTFMVVPGVGHSADQMYKSPEMRILLNEGVTV